MSNICRLGHVNRHELIKLRNTLNLREYKSSDFEQIIKLWEETGIGSIQRGDTREVIEKTVSAGAKFFVLENNGKIIGSSWITTDLRRLYLHHFAIKPEFQGKGYSKILLEKSLEYAEQQKMQIKLEVHKNNTKAISLYEKYGFKYLGDYLVYIIRDIEKL